MLLNEIDWKRLIEHGEIQDAQVKRNLKMSNFLLFWSIIRKKTKKINHRTFQNIKNQKNFKKISIKNFLKSRVLMVK